MKVMIVKELMTGDVSPVAMFNCQITYTCPGFAVKIFDNCLCTKIVKNLIVSLISFSDFLVFMFLFGVFSKCILRPQLLLAKVAL